MEGNKSEVVQLFSSWAGPYCTRVELALKLKGIPYECIEEDLANKSESLLAFNPVHKKVPVLVHKGKPLAESLVILEYIDEYWNTTPKLLPEDPHERAKVRFWTNFYDEKIVKSGISIVKSKGKEQKKAIEDLEESLKVFEDGIKGDFPGKFSIFNGEILLGLLEIVVGSNACNYEAFSEVFAEIGKPERCPDFFSWVKALKEYPLIKETLPPHDKLVETLKAVLAFLQTPEGSSILKKY